MQVNKAALPFYVFRSRDLLWMLPATLGGWIVLAICGVDFEVGFLLAVSGMAIGVTAFSYRAAYRHAGYWATLGAYAFLHVLFFSFVGGGWLPMPTGLFSPFILLDYFAMAFLLPKVIGVKFALG